MEKHLKRLAAANLALGTLHVAAGALLVAAVGGATFHFGVIEDESFLHAMLSLVSLLLLFTGILALLTGILIHQRTPRGKIAGLTSSFFLLLVVPLGTLVGSYGIWVLFQDDIEDYLKGRGRARISVESQR